MRKYVASDVSKAVLRAFPDQHECVLDLLNEYGKEAYESEKDRVRLAIIKLSKGSANKLLDYIKLAKEDYRDVLLLAEYDKDQKEIPNPYQDLLN